MNITVATPERHALGPVEVKSVTLPGDQGEMTLLPEHARLISTLASGALSLECSDGTKKVAAVSGGFVEVNANRIVILADTLEFAEEIDLARAKKAEERANSALKSKESAGADLRENQDSLARAINRQEIAQRVQKQ